MLPPHKVWTHDLVPRNSHEHIHPVSWCPMKYRRLAWHRWLLGLQSRHGYSHYATFWRDDPPLTSARCATRATTSVYTVCWRTATPPTP